jgi:hypothetical protein
MLEIGTIDGARSMGLGDVTGSLTPGKRADVIMISTNALNMGVFTEPAHMALECTQPENIEMVIVDGRVLKSGGKLTSLSTPIIIREARASLEGVRKRTGWRSARVRRASGHQGVRCRRRIDRRVLEVTPTFRDLSHLPQRAPSPLLRREREACGKGKLTDAK